MFVKIDRVSKNYNNVTAVRDVSLTVEKGERIVLFGPSGCGKTTFLRIIAGLLNPDTGTIVIDGQVVAENGKNIVEPEYRHVGMVFQDLALWPHMDVYHNIEFGLKARKAAKAVRAQLIDTILEKVKMTQYRDSYPGELSGGQQQRVALARALVVRPNILLMDEPLSSLDQELKLLLIREILELQREFGTTMIYVTHDRYEAFALATKVALMENGMIKNIGPANDVLENL